MKRIGWLLSMLVLVACSDTEQPTARGEGVSHPGESTYRKFCIACHQLGISGAPKLGDAEVWQERTAQGFDAMFARTLEGIPPAMPPKGGCVQCTENELRASIEYMLDQSLQVESSR